MMHHFKAGKDAAVMTLDKAVLTSENMYSTKKGYPNAAERARADLEQRKLENVTQIKIENSLLCQLKEELIQEKNQYKEHCVSLQEKLAVFEELDLEKIKRAAEDYERLQQENIRITKSFTTSDAERHKLFKESRKLMLYEEQYKSSVNSTIDFNNDLLRQVVELRKELTCEELDDL